MKDTIGKHSRFSLALALSLLGICAAVAVSATTAVNPPTCCPDCSYSNAKKCWYRVAQQSFS
jgi:hypothetical protein